MTPSAEEERCNLETIALCMAIDVPDAIRAEVVTGAARLLFYQSSGLFFGLPA